MSEQATTPDVRRLRALVETWRRGGNAELATRLGGDFQVQAYTLRMCADELAALLTVPAEGPSGWQPIETAPKDREVWFYIRPKTAEETYTDTSGNPILSAGPPSVRRTRYGWWSSLEKATHWHEDTIPEAPDA